MMWRALYSLLTTLALPAVWLRLRVRGFGAAAYRDRRGERFGQLPDDLPRGAIWFHTVSAGETIAAAPLIESLRERFPHIPFLVTTMTPTGSEQVRRLLPGVAHCYAPYDFPWAVRRFLDRIGPRLLVLMETELWPNLVRATSARGVGVVLANARLSARSARGYRAIGGLTRPMLAAIDHIACQQAEHRQRFIDLGARPEHVSVLGNIKFDLVFPEDLEYRTEALRAHLALGAGPAWIGASTHEGEEAVLLDAHRRLLQAHSDLVLLLVPRHPERFDAVAQLAAAQGFTVARRTARGGDERAQVVIGDTMGELVFMYGLVDVAFVGGSLVDRGGHNPIEAAAWGVPILMGPSVFNFDHVVALFERAGSLERVVDAGQVAAQVGRWLDDSALRTRAGTAGREVVVANRGARARLEVMLAERIERHCGGAM